MSESVAVFVTTSGVSSVTVRFVCAGSTGAELTSLTTTLKELVALSKGEPSSVTTTVTVFVLGPSASVGVQLIAPDEGLIVIPAGCEIRL
jgi:hypothetical protein